MQLNEFQERFKALMLDNPKALDTPPEELAQFCKADAISLPTRLKVYRNNIVGSLTDMLKTTFPTIKALVGEQFFEMLARSFILQHPPSKGVLSHYGEGMDAFIRAFELAKSLPYLPDIATYEIAKNHSYHAADDLPLTTEQLAAVPAEDLDTLHIGLRAYVFLVASKYPLTAIEEFCKNKKTDETLDLDQGGECLMVFRSSLDTKTDILAKDEFEFLRQLSEGASLGEATEAVLSHHPDFNIQAVLQKHLALETFRAL